MEALSKKKIFITGIGGFTGTHLENEMTKLGYDVYGSIFSESHKKNHFKCNILKKEELINILRKVRPDYIVHLAAISYVASENISLMYETNVLGTVNVLEALGKIKHNVKKILIASSAAVYGNIGRELSEEMCPKPINHYGNSKLAMENMVANYYNKFNIIITRPFNYTGVGQEQNFLVPKIVSHFKKKKSYIELGNLNTYREYNDVKYLTKNYIGLLQSKFKSGVVNVSSGITYNIEDILNKMENISNHSIEVRINNDFVRKNEIEELKGSTERLEKIFDKKIKIYPLENTLMKMYINYP